MGGCRPSSASVGLSLVAPTPTLRNIDVDVLVSKLADAAQPQLASSMSQKMGEYMAAYFSPVDDEVAYDQPEAEACPMEESCTGEGAVGSASEQETSVASIPVQRPPLGFPYPPENTGYDPHTVWPPQYAYGTHAPYMAPNVTSAWQAQAATKDARSTFVVPDSLSTALSSLLPTSRQAVLDAFLRERE